MNIYNKTIILIVLYVKLEYIVDKYYSATNASMEVILIILKIGLLKYFIIIKFLFIILFKNLFFIQHSNLNVRSVSIANVLILKITI